MKVQPQGGESTEVDSPPCDWKSSSVCSSSCQMVIPWPKIPNLLLIMLFSLFFRLTNDLSLAISSHLMVDDALQLVLQVGEGFIVAGPAREVQRSRGWSCQILALDYPIKRFERQIMFFVVFLKKYHAAVKRIYLFITNICYIKNRRFILCKSVILPIQSK